MGVSVNAGHLGRKIASAGATLSPVFIWRTALAARDSSPLLMVEHQFLEMVLYKQCRIEQSYVHLELAEWMPPCDFIEGANCLHGTFVILLWEIACVFLYWVKKLAVKLWKKIFWSNRKRQYLKGKSAHCLNFNNRIERGSYSQSLSVYQLLVGFSYKLVTPSSAFITAIDLPARSCSFTLSNNLLTSIYLSELIALPSPLWSGHHVVNDPVVYRPARSLNTSLVDVGCSLPVDRCQPDLWTYGTSRMIGLANCPLTWAGSGRRGRGVLLKGNQDSHQ